MSDDPINIRDLMAQLCERLGLDPESTLSLTISPGDVVARTLIRDNGGHARVLPSGDIDTHVVRLKVYS